MDTLPIETIIELASCDVQVYRALVMAYPRFARWVTRVTIFEPMVWFGYDVRIFHYQPYDPIIESTTVWYRNGLKHAIAWPAKTSAYCSEWYCHGLLHRVGGPAYVNIDGVQRWYIHEEYHRDDGPAITWPGAYQAWYQHGKLHREDGPAIVYLMNGSTEFWINGVAMPH